MDVTKIIPEKPDVQIILSYDEAIALRIVLGQSNSINMYNATELKGHTTQSQMTALIERLHCKLESMLHLKT